MPGVAIDAEEGRGCPQGAKSTTGGEWSASWQVTKSSKVAYLLRRLSEIGAIPPRSPGSPENDVTLSLDPLQVSSPALTAMKICLLIPCGYFPVIIYEAVQTCQSTLTVV